MRIVEFEICHQPQNTQTLQLINALTQNGFVVQLDRITDFGSVGWGFESLRGHRFEIIWKTKPLKSLIFRGFLFLKLFILFHISSQLRTNCGQNYIFGQNYTCYEIHFALF